MLHLQMHPMKNRAMKGLAGLAVLFVAIQIIPYGRNHSNPRIRQEPKWDRLETRLMARHACMDCHSNQTLWPWYSSIAPISWLIQRDVDEGRRELNFSEWDRPQKEAAGAARLIRSGEMPPRSYLLAHPEARLQPADTEALAIGLENTLKIPVVTVGQLR